MTLIGRSNRGETSGSNNNSTFRPKTSVKSNGKHRSESGVRPAALEYNLRMKTSLLQRVVCLLMIYVLLVPQTWATCGGGGGGGMGGMGAGSSQQTYQVPWKLIKPEDTVKEGLAVYWFPSSQNELEKSSLRESRTLQLYSGQCVTMGIADARTALGQKYVPDGKVPVVLLVQADGTVVNKVAD